MDQSSPYEIKLRLVITDFECAPSDITRLLEVEPTRTWLQGERASAKADTQYKMNGWEVVESSESAETGMPKLVDNLIATFEPKANNFAKLPKEAEVLLSCVVFPRKYCPELGFRPDQIDFLGKIRASVDFDIYT